MDNDSFSAAITSYQIDNPHLMPVFAVFAAEQDSDGLAFTATGGPAPNVAVAEQMGQKVLGEDACIFLVACFN